MIKYLDILVERLQIFFQKYSFKNSNQLFQQRPMFSREDLISCLQANESDEFCQNIITLSSTFDITGSNFYNSTSEEDIRPQLLSIEQICSLIDDELEIINENKIVTQLESRESFPTISRDDNFNTQISKPWNYKMNSYKDLTTRTSTKSRKIKVIKKKKSSIY